MADMKNSKHSSSRDCPDVISRTDTQLTQLVIRIAQIINCELYCVHWCSSWQRNMSLRPYVDSLLSFHTDSLLTETWMLVVECFTSLNVPCTVIMWILEGPVVCVVWCAHGEFMSCVLYLSMSHTSDARLCGPPHVCVGRPIFSRDVLRYLHTAVVLVPVFTGCLLHVKQLFQHILCILLTYCFLLSEDWFPRGHVNIGNILLSHHKC